MYSIAQPPNISERFRLLFVVPSLVPRLFLITHAHTRARVCAYLQIPKAFILYNTRASRDASKIFGYAIKHIEMCDKFAAR